MAYIDQRSVGGAIAGPLAGVWREYRTDWAGRAFSLCSNSPVQWREDSNLNPAMRRECDQTKPQSGQPITML